MLEREIEKERGEGERERKCEKGRERGEREKDVYF
jgi:hypothetical protein